MSVTKQEFLTYQHPGLIARYQKEKQSDEATAARAFRQMLLFLFICGESSGGCVPSKTVDGMWHTFLWFTEAYAAFCARYCGRFIHHRPSSSEQDSAAMAVEYRRTRDRVREEFPNEFDASLWPDPASANQPGPADDCDGGCGLADCV